MNSDFVSLGDLGLGIDVLGSRVPAEVSQIWAKAAAEKAAAQPPAAWAPSKALIIGGVAAAVGLLLLVALASRR